MTQRRFVELDSAALGPTRDALHACARVLGDSLKALAPKRKHWWHASLRPSLDGLTTGVVRASTDFEIELDMRASRLRLTASDGSEDALMLGGERSLEVGAAVQRFLRSIGVAVAFDGPAAERVSFDGYSTAHAAAMGAAMADVAACMEAFRAGLREETSPIQVWPHHFDLSMIWLPGDKVPDTDPDDEEISDRQMNFGFTFGDDSVPEPYFYVTAYPRPDWLHRLSLPAEAHWHAEGFEGALLRYARLRSAPQPANRLLSFWRGLLEAGRAPQ